MPVVFDEASHRYTSHKGYDYVSVTTLIKQYTPPFDADFWSAYKALKDVLTDKGEWRAYLDKVGGWENVVLAARMDKAFKYKKEVVVRKKEYLRDWDENRDKAARAGTKFHKAREAETKKDLVFDDTFIPVIADIDLLGLNELARKAGKPKIEDGLCTELLLYDDELEIAGQADWVLLKDGEVFIKDYKTSKEIKMKPFAEEVLLHPLETFPNCNFYVYSIQLSLYAFILERAGYKISRLTIEHIDRSTFETIATYPAEYHRKAVIKLLTHYCASREKKSRVAVKSGPSTGSS